MKKYIIWGLVAFALYKLLWDGFSISNGDGTSSTYGGWLHPALKQS